MSIAKGGNIKKMKMVTIVMISGFFSIIVSFIFMIVYFLGEQFGFAAVITLGTIEGFFAGEGVIIFVVILLGSVFLGSFIVLYLLKRFS